ncbi:hypothetical protein ACWEKM_27310, partial [Streptomyces sp. NPDC004752]
PVRLARAVCGDKSHARFRGGGGAAMRRRYPTEGETPLGYSAFHRVCELVVFMSRRLTREPTMNWRDT